MKIAIVGFGVANRSALKYFQAKYPAADFTIFDQNDKITDLPDGISAVLGEDAFARVDGYDLVIKAPSVQPWAIEQQTNHWSATREFLRECPCKIIGVTGSKGKGTTVSFIQSIMQAHFDELNAADHGARTAYAVGNIGVPELDKLPLMTADDVAVYEMSSFQCWDIEQSPSIAVITMIEPDHLNVHRDFDEYVSAKANIFRYQKAGDLAIFNEANAVTNKLVSQIATTSPAEFIPYPDKNFVHFDHENFYYNSKTDDEIVCPISAVKLPGEHNLLNACAAIAATWALTGHDRDATRKGLAGFGGLPHRLKFVREVEGVKFYDDSIATTPGSAIAAIWAFKEPKILILGGSDKGADYYELGEVIETGNVKTVFAIGANRSKVAEQVTSRTKVPVVELSNDNLRDIVDIAYDAANPGDVVILSPAAASFDMFKSYKDRGEQFIAAASAL